MLFNVSMQLPEQNLIGAIHNLEERGYVVTECTPINENLELVSFRIDSDRIDFESIDAEISEIEHVVGGQVCTCVEASAVDV